MYSITYGEVSFEEMYKLIRAYTSQGDNVRYELAVGTDSQNFSYTKVPVTQRTVFLWSSMVSKRGA